MLRVDDVSVSYGSVLAVRSASLTVAPSSVVALVGPNGSGKTSLLSAVAGLVPHDGGVWIGDAQIGALPAEERAAAGLAFVPDGRRLFGKLTVEQNLRVGAVRIRGRRRAASAVDATLARFPALAALRAHIASTLSGGEGQLLTIARALVSSPRALLVDEPFQGLSSEATALVLDALHGAARDGAAVVVATPEPIDGVPSIPFASGAPAQVHA